MLGFVFGRLLASAIEYAGSDRLYPGAQGTRFMWHVRQQETSMYLLFIPALLAVLVIGFIQLRDQFDFAKSKQSDKSGL